MELETLKDLNIHELKDLYSAENQLLKALPKMAKAATNRQLAKGSTDHLAQTEAHAVRLENDSRERNGRLRMRSHLCRTPGRLQRSKDVANYVGRRSCHGSKANKAGKVHDQS